jgi:hypothetical protein
MEKSIARRHYMAMTDSQLYLAVGLPMFVVLLNILVSALQVNTINGRFTSLEAAFGSRIGSLETAVNARMGSLEARFDTLIGKVIEIDNRLTRVEERLDRR